MNRNVLAQLILTFLFLYFLISASAEVIQLKDGRTFNGNIVNEDNETISVEVHFLNGKLVQKILKSEIEPREVTAPDETKTVNLLVQEQKKEIPRADQIRGENEQKFF